MHQVFTYAAYGWLAFSGTVHFTIDVVSQHFRRKRSAGPETTLFYGLHSSFALGQVLFGLLCLWLAWSAPAVLAQAPVTMLSLAGGVAWLAITIAFISFREPKINAAIFILLLLASAATV
ncbi:hypothetical protein [Sphingomonas sp. CROZ-RG-20F-R02-07]|uniref:hypothetical protein n=1 Tax=Sphingomonas sp. CROZ-RG-20F-R02-07 TaxID=2914832 RepID=UPI001F588D0B|nr:hypothetical protein [Sphingomonas sp. CROZ-RG-20F-R02-07]